MTKSPPVIELSWRDENYGSVCAVAAFRNYAGTLDWSDRTHQRFRGCLKRAGFASTMAGAATSPPAAPARIGSAPFVTSWPAQASRSTAAT